MNCKFGERSAKVIESHHRKAFNESHLDFGELSITAYLDQCVIKLAEAPENKLFFCHKNLQTPVLRRRSFCADRKFANFGHSVCT